MRYIIDSSAWIEYLEGTKKGEKIRNILKGDNDAVLLAINLAEIISKAKRMKYDTEQVYESLINNAQIFEITPKIAKEAGLLHAQMKEKIEDFGLVDAIIVSAARSISAKIVTEDRHFRGFKEAIII